MTLQDYNNLSTQNLVDLLAQETERFTQLIAAKEFTTEYNEMKGTIKLIQEIISSRSETATQTHPDISFTQPNSTV